MGKYKEKRIGNLGMPTVCVRPWKKYWKEEWGYLKASKVFGVPRTTLEARVKKREDLAKKGLGYHKPVFSPEQEEQLVQHILSMEARLFGFTLNDLRSLAFQLAFRNNLPHQFNIEKKKAGKAWLYGFLSRHPNVRLRTPEPTSLARAIGFNRPAVEKYFLLLREVLDKHKIPPDRIYNVDETGVMTVPKKQSKCLSLKGKDSWFDQFISFSKPSKEHPVLLLLDGPTTHTKNLDVIDKAREKGVVLLCFPPHTTHRLQPLDVSFMAPLSTYYSSEVQRWMQQHPGRPVTIAQIGKLFGTAYMKAASVQTAVNGFRKTGIHPLNPEIFPDWMYEPAETTNRPIDAHDQDQENNISLSQVQLSPPATSQTTVPTNLNKNMQPLSPRNPFQQIQPSSPKTPPRSTIPIPQVQVRNMQQLSPRNPFQPKRLE
ncbi:hypothetical protein NQ317_013486 [Molorchus minor]|uniref:HTH CENPB-type domain-containing protein n=1 Tax=Molorchus minor TaxID=1323400 RepID=A0ABQ9JBG0_9CUCU|nr:hypothetical protein NQ317_013486 [Molorchus minor]